MQGNRTLPRLCMKREGSDRNVLNGIVGGDKYRRMFLRCLVREMGAFVLSFVVYSRDRSGQYPLSGDSPDAVCRYVELVRGRIFPLLHGLSGVSRDRPSRARTGQDGPRRSRAEQRSGRDRLRRDRGEIVANRTEPNLTGPSRTEPDRAGPSRTEQDRAGPSRTGLTVRNMPSPGAPAAGKKKGLSNTFQPPPLFVLLFENFPNRQFSEGQKTC